jgi:ABC-type branched-subunit amino acid transport system substrate-binding protein
LARAKSVVVGAAVAVAGALVAIPALPASASTAAGLFAPVAPVRIFDTQTGNGVPKALLAPHGTLTVQITGRDGVPSAGVGSVLLNLGVAQTAAAGSVVAYPAGASRPATSSLAFASGQTVENLTMTRLGTGGRISIYNNSTSSIRVFGDVGGYYGAGTVSAAGGFVPVTQTRIADSATGVGLPRATIAAHQTVTITVAGHGGVPTSGAGSVALNLWAYGTGAAGSLIAYPAGSTRPGITGVAFAAHQIVETLTVTRLGSGGAISVYNNSAGTLRLLGDLAGYFRAGTAGAGGYVPVTPTRIVDTTAGLGAATPSGSVTTGVQVDGLAGLPASGVRAVVVNLGSRAASAAGNLIGYADGITAPSVSSLAFPAGQPAANLAVVPVGADGSVDLATVTSGSAPLTVDVVGYVPGVAPVASCSGLADATGITGTSITLGNASDISGPHPQLYTSAQQATEAYAAYANSLGGLCGRTLSIDAQDSGTSDSGDQQAATAACADDFTTVGSMSLFDDGGAQTRQDCGIPDLRAQPTSAQAQSATDSVAANYGEVTSVSAAGPAYFAHQFPTRVAHAGIVYMNAGAGAAIASSQVAAWKHDGYTFVMDEAMQVTNPDYSGLVAEMASKGVHLLLVDAFDNLVAGLKQRIAADNLDIVVVAAPEVYTSAYPGYSGSDATYGTDSAVLLSSSNPQVVLYKHWLQVVAPGATPDYYGLLAWSASALFVTEAASLGGSLSRAALISALANVHGWTGFGVTVPQDLAAKRAPACTSVVELSGGAWSTRSPFRCAAVLATA